METPKFTSEKLLEHLVKRFENLNDNGAKAQEVYNLIINKKNTR